MLAHLQPAIPLPFPKVAGYSASRDRLVRRTAASTTLTALIAILLVSFLSLLLVLN